MFKKGNRRPEVDGSGEMAERPKGEVYGYLLTIRFLSKFGIEHGSTHAAALRVLCMMAEYANDDGRCFLSSQTIGARLGVTRQAVAKQIRHLEALGYLTVDRMEGSTPRYALNRDGLERERWRDGAAKARYEEKRQARRAAQRAAP